MGTGTEEKKQVISNRDVDEKQEEEEEGIPLPGFRFHPTDEELVGFYLHRKVHKKPITIELIKQIDIYKYDPWDLPKIGVGEKEWYFYCKRGRKYRNSIRPNRVTGCGFWKATGIDRPIYNSAAACIGLKKSLVFYRGSAGKGTKTDWMMHEFRLPPPPLINNTPLPQQPAEVWTLCRIVKRNGCQKKTLPDWREITANSNNYAATKRNNKSKRCSSSSSDEIMQSYISFQAATAPLNIQQIYTTRPSHGGDDAMMKVTAAPSTESTSPLISSGCSSFSDVNEEVLLKHGNWDDLRSVVQFANATSHPIFFM